jgi:hypothetical protein
MGAATRPPRGSGPSPAQLTIGWEHSPNLESLDPGSDEQVYRLMLSGKAWPRYKNIRLSVTRHSADPQAGRMDRLERPGCFDFRKIRLNQGINEDNLPIMHCKCK